jgi:diaminohydroxyphosphoribosylaminopyrimidine deaminase/5-amino-6-(5-phosphoribosylamino)uracil reductase
VGIGENRARQMNEAYLKHVITGRPFVILKCAATLDGRIATRTGDSRWISGEASRDFVHRLRHAVDAVMVGVGTVKADNPRLTTRLTDRPGADPLRIILDTHLSVPREAVVLQSASEAETWLVTGPSVKSSDRQDLERPGVRLVAVPLREGRIDLDVVMDELGRAGVTSLLVEGGAGVLASALKAGIADKLYFFYAPKILGGDDGVPICRGPGPDRMADCLKIKDVRIHRFDDDVMIEGYTKN